MVTKLDLSFNNFDDEGEIKLSGGLQSTTFVPRKGANDYFIHRTLRHSRKFVTQVVSMSKLLEEKVAKSFEYFGSAKSSTDDTLDFTFNFLERYLRSLVHS